jgi:hypothetical protein
VRVAVRSSRPDSQRCVSLLLPAVIPIMEMLEAPNSNVLQAILSLVSQVVAVDKDNKFQQSLSLVGFVPALVKFGAHHYPLDVRLVLAHFIQTFCTGDKVPLLRDCLAGTGLLITGFIGCQHSQIIADFSRKMFISGGKC